MSKTIHGVHATTVSGLPRLHLFGNRKAADAFVTHQVNAGGYAEGAMRVETIPVYDDIAELLGTHEQEERTAALGKLTDRERQLLNLGGTAEAPKPGAATPESTGTGVTAEQVAAKSQVFTALDYEARTVAELRALADERKVEVKSSATKAEIIAALTTPAAPAA